MIAFNNIIQLLCRYIEICRKMKTALPVYFLLPLSILVKLDSFQPNSLHLLSSSDLHCKYKCTILYTSHDMTKPTKRLCAQRRLRSSAQSDQSLRCPHEGTWVLRYPLSAQRRLWSDWADAQADLSLRWARNHFVGFVMSRLK